jgi:biopolymer transport protein ExbB/TolQ
MSLSSLVSQGGLSLLALIPLLVCSILIIAVILERIWSYAHIGKAPKELLGRIEDKVSAGQWHDAVDLLEDYDTPYARVAKASLLRQEASQQEVSDMLTLACDQELNNAVRSLPVLGTIGNIAPFIGLFGTVIGIMHAFQSLADSNLTGNTVIMKDIAEALIFTGMGLGIGIISVVANNWCQSWVERYRLELERFSTEWSYRLQHVKQPTQQIAEPVA